MTLINQLGDIGEADTQLFGFDEQLIDAFSEYFQAFAASQRGALVRDVGSGCTPLFHDPADFQFAVGAGNGVGVYDQFFCQHANGGQFSAGRQPSGGHQVPDLIDDLKVNGNFVASIDVDLHGNGFRWGLLY